MHILNYRSRRPLCFPKSPSFLRSGLSLVLFAKFLAGPLAQAQEKNSAAQTAQNADRASEKQNGASSAFSTVALTTSMEVLNDTDKLGKGDVVSFRVVEDQRDPIALIVTDSGEMEVPFIGRVVAAGKTCKQLARELKPLLEKEYFYKATVIIGLDAIGTKSRGKVYLTGEVKTQGALELMPDEAMTVSRAILRAGGLADFANKKKVKLVRKKAGGGTETIFVNLGDIIDKGQLDKDPVLEPGDVIVVPERLINF
jgi:protein involved in polysaccharide export with SLBB domain